MTYGAPVKRPTKQPRWLRAGRAAGAAFDSKQKPDWLARALARAGHLPLADAGEAIVKGRVRIGARVVHEPFAPLLPGSEVFLDGVRVDVTPRTLVMMFHKPNGVVTSNVDQHGDGTVFDAFQRKLTPELNKYTWHAVGRLDRNTTGLLLFTNDEKFVAHATSPDSHLEKHYVATVDKKATDAQLEPLRQGMELDDGPTRPAKATLTEPGLISVVLTEGKNHQAKRMLGAVGLPVRALHRASIGGLQLDIPVGEVRAVTAEEIEKLLGYSPRTG